MARPFSLERHNDLIGRVIRRNDRLTNHTENANEIKALKEIARKAAVVQKYLERGDFAGCYAYMKKTPALVEQLPETFETAGNQAELAKSRKEAA